MTFIRNNRCIEIDLIFSKLAAVNLTAQYFNINFNKLNERRFIIISMGDSNGCVNQNQVGMHFKFNYIKSDNTQIKLSLYNNIDSTKATTCKVRKCHINQNYFDVCITKIKIQNNKYNNDIDDKIHLLTMINTILYEKHTLSLTQF